MFTLRLIKKIDLLANNYYNNISYLLKFKF